MNAEPRGYRFPAVSPDGRWAAVTVDRRPSDLWIVDLLRGTAERQPTPSHDGWGVWSPNGDRIAFLWGENIFSRGGNSIVAVPVRAGNGFDVTGPPTELFSGSFDFTQERNWDVMPDGRFLMVQGDPTTTTRLEVVLNWFEELKRMSGG